MARYGLALILGLGLIGCGGDDDDGGGNGGGGPQPTAQPNRPAGSGLEGRASMAEREESDEFCPEEAVGFGVCCDSEGNCGGATGDIVAWCCETGVLCWVNCPALVEASQCAIVDGQLDCWVEADGPCNDDDICDCDEDADSCADCSADCTDDGTCAAEEEPDCTDCAGECP